MCCNCFIDEIASRISLLVVCESHYKFANSLTLKSLLLEELVENLCYITAYYFSIFTFIHPTWLTSHSHLRQGGFYFVWRTSIDVKRRPSEDAQVQGWSKNVSSLEEDLKTWGFWNGLMLYCLNKFRECGSDVLLLQ